MGWMGENMFERETHKKVKSVKCKLIGLISSPLLPCSSFFNIDKKFHSELETFIILLHFGVVERKSGFREWTRLNPMFFC
jgi:hypothetical protein